MIEEIAKPAIEWVLGGSGQTTVVLILLIVIVYFRKALGLGSLLADWVGRVIFSAGTLLVLLVTGVVPGINIDRLHALIEDTISIGREILPEIL